MVEIYITANNRQTVKEKLVSASAFERSASARILPITVEECTDVASHTECINTTQGKVCLLYTTRRKLTEDERKLIKKILYKTAMLKQGTLAGNRGKHRR